MLQFKIPQNVQREDQIVSFLTMRQLLILAVGGGICYLLFMIFAKFYFLGMVDTIAIIIFPASITLCIAFLNIQGVSFTKWMLLVIEYNLNPQRRIWSNKFLITEELNAIITNTNQVKNNSKKKEDIKTVETQHKSLSELVEEINLNRAQYKKKNNLPITSNFATFDIEDLERIQNLNLLDANGKNNNQVNPVLIQTKEPNHHDLILNESMNKIKTVRPNLTTPEQNVQNILNENNSKLKI